MIRFSRSYPFLPLLLLSACASGSKGIVDLPADASGALYTDRSVDSVAGCLGAATGDAVQVRGDRRVVTSGEPGTVSYDVGPNPSSTIYPTMVMIHGIEQRYTTETHASACGLQLPSEAMGNR